MAMNGSGAGPAGRRLMVVSHPAVLPVNQLVYAALASRGRPVELVVPDHWRHGYATGDVEPAPVPALARSFKPVRVALAGRPQRHFYLTDPRRLIRAARPEVLFLEQEPFALAAGQWGAAAHSLGIPFGVQIDENLDRPLPAPVRAMRTWVLSHAAFVAARSETAADLARRWGASGRVEVVPHHIPDWTPMKREDGDRFRVGFAGRLVPEKGLDVLVDAVRRLEPPVDLVVAGEGPMRDWLSSQDLSGSRLRWVTGLHHEEMNAAYAEMDVLVLPSRSTPRWTEQFGRTLVEALSCGVPVIGSDSGEIPWVVDSTGGGRLFPEGDSAALARLLDELRDDEPGRRELATRGGRRALELFGVESVATQLGELVDAAGGAPDPPTDPGPTDPRPTVAIVAHGIHDRGGMERACAELIRRTHEQFRYVAVTAEIAPDLAALVEDVALIRVPARPIPLKFVAFFALAGAALRRVRPDLVHTVGAIVPNRIDVAAVQYCHAGAREAWGTLSPPGAPPSRRVNTFLARALAIAAERWCYRPGRIRRLAPVSSGVADELVRHYPGIPTTVITNGVDIARFRPGSDDRAATRTELGAGDDEMVGLFVGGDWDRKGLAIAIEAVAKARAGGLAVVLWILGEGNQARFARLAGQFDVDEAVVFLGRRTDTERYYRAADAFVFPTLYEAFSLATLEAAASGLPLIATGVNGTAELIGDGEGGLVVERSPEAFATALLRLGRDPAAASLLASQARHRAEGFTWDRSAVDTAALYRELAGTAAPERR